MSTLVYQTTLYTDVYKKEDLVKSLNEQTESIKNQIENGMEIIEFNLLGMQILIDFRDEDISIIN